MFNEKLKNIYIKEKSKSVTLPSNYLECQFNKVEKMEEESNKDVCNFTAYEIIEYYKTLNIAALESLAVMNSHFSMYTQWCLQNNIVKDNQNHFLEIDLEQIKKCLNKTIFTKKIVSRSQVIAWCDQLPNPKDQLVILGLFEGIKGKDFSDFVNLKPKDINGNIVKLFDGREITISNKLLGYIKDSIRETTYYSSTGGQTKTMPLVDKGYVIKSYPNTKEGTSDFIKGRIIYNSIARSLSYVGVLSYMSANSIFESGKIHMIKNRSSELGITPKEYIYSEHIKEVEDKYNCKIVKSVFLIKYKDYL